jgi:hypothetical protein
MTMAFFPFSVIATIAMPTFSKNANVPERLM